jgi:chemotaxis protein MotB
MKALYMRRPILVLAACATLASCVSTGKYNSSRAEAMRLQSELAANRRESKELATRMDELQGRFNAAIRDTARLFSECRELAGRNTALQNKYDLLLSAGSVESARVLRQLEANQAELDAHSRRVAELEQMLRAREQAIETIRRQVADALPGFEGRGLTVTSKDGKVYVSMDDKLLFRSGRWEVEPAGAQAVRDLAAVLAADPDIAVMVEGHTDDVPYRTSGPLVDNLDLSVKRATTVTRLLLENKGIAPSRIISAGRGESLPVAIGTDAEARARNRRTEVILTPKLDELMRLMEGEK